MRESQKAFSQIYDEYVVSIYRFVYVKVGVQELAEDICADVFLRVWETYQATFSSEEYQIENPRALLYQVARNTVADYYRNGQKARIIPLEDGTDIEDSDSMVPLDEAVRSLEMDQIRKALLALPADYQDLILMRYVDELSFPEIALACGKSEEAARVGVHRGLKMLREQFPEESPALTLQESSNKL